MEWQVPSCSFQFTSAVTASLINTWTNHPHSTSGRNLIMGRQEGNVRLSFLQSCVTVQVVTYTICEWCSFKVKKIQSYSWNRIRLFPCTQYGIHTIFRSISGLVCAVHAAGKMLTFRVCRNIKSWRRSCVPELNPVFLAKDDTIICQSKNLGRKYVPLRSCLFVFGVA